MYCRYCGSENENKGNFCRKCGAALGEKKKVGDDFSKAVIPSTKHHHRKVFFVVFALLIMGGLLIWEKVYDRQPKRQYEEVVSQMGIDEADYQRTLGFQEIIENSRGETSGVSYTSGRIQTYGFCFAELIDFEGDGTERLVLVHTLGIYDVNYLPSTIDDYILEIWDYRDGIAQKIFEAKPYNSFKDEWEVNLLNIENKRYLKVEDKTGKDIYYGVEDGVFVQKDKANMESGFTEIYVLQGTYSGADSDEKKIAYNTVNNLEQKISHRVESFQYEQQNTIMEDANGLVPIENGSYTFESEDLNMYACVYIDCNGEAKISLRCNYLDDTYRNTENIIFQYNKDTGIYEESGQLDGEEKYISIEQDGDTISIILITEPTQEPLKAELVRETEY